MKDSEIFPWRYGRRLSLLSRPILQLDTDPDPSLMVSPTLLRIGFAHVLSGAYHGSLRPEFFHTDALAKRWREKAQEGHTFTAQVAASLKESGWETRENLGLTELLQRKLPKDFGDVDVLAWRSDSPTVLVIECKDLAERRNYSEIAAQLSDYQGQLKRGKEDKLLKHLNRVTLLANEGPAVSKFTGVSAPELSSCLVVSGLVPMQFAKIPTLSSTFVGSVEELMVRHGKP
jgi:hypothetical protein